MTKFHRYGRIWYTNKREVYDTRKPNEDICFDSGLKAYYIAPVKENNERYHQIYNPKMDRWVKMNSYTGLIVAVKESPGEYNNLSKKPSGKLKIGKAFWERY